MSTDNLKTVQALVDALDGSVPKPGNLVKREAARAAGRALIAQMQREPKQERRLCARCGDLLMSAFTDLCYSCNQVMMQREAVQPAVPGTVDEILEWIVSMSDDEPIRNMARAARTKFAEAQALDSQLQQPDGHSTNAASEASTAPLPAESDEGPPTEALWMSPSGIEYRRQDGRWRRYSKRWPGHWNGSETVNMLEQEMLDAVAGTGADTARHGQDDHAGSPAPSDESDMLTVAYMDGYAKGKRAAESSKASLSDKEIDAAMDEVWGSVWERDEFRAFARAILSRAGIGESRREPLPLTRLNELAKVYALSYASPHHFTMSCEGLRSLIEGITKEPRA